MIKNLFKPIIHFIFKKIRYQLNIDEQERILNHIAHHVGLIEIKQKKIEDYLKAINTAVSGIQTENNSLYDEFNIAEYEIRELHEILKSNKKNKVGLINFFSLIKKVNFKDKTVIAFGDEENLMKSKLSQLGANSIKQIKFVPKNSGPLSEKDDFIYPMNLNKISLDKHDIAICYDENVSSILLKNKLFDLGNLIKESVILRVSVISNTVFKNDTDPKIKLDEKNQKLIFNDNFVRYQLHNSGFNEVSCIYTYGNNLDNFFDEKVTSFRYKDGFYIKRSNNKFKSNKKYNNSDSIYKIYIANKLPSIKNINIS